RPVEPDPPARQSESAHYGQAGRAGRAAQVRPGPLEPAGRGRQGQQDQPGREQPVHGSVHSWPTAISRALRMPNGLGGEPGSQTSTGTVAKTPPATASLSRSSPPLTASVPTAITTFGSGIPS